LLTLIGFRCNSVLQTVSQHTSGACVWVRGATLAVSAKQRVVTKGEGRLPSSHPILSHNANSGFHCDFMDATETINTQVALPIELYQAIAQRAQVHGKSVNGEIVALLLSLIEDAARLAQEFADWEAASDEDWLHMEATLTSQEN
jgi:hypothetical protein